MTLTANGRDILAVWNDVDPAHEAEYHRWYWQQHLPERLSIPGFMSAYRYQAVKGSPRFFTWYFVRDIEVLRSPRYLERLSNPTDWTQRVMPWFGNMTRCACRLTVDCGRGIGGTIVVARISAAGGPADLARLLRERVAEMSEASGESIVTRAQVWETDREISVQRTPEQALRREPDRLIDHAIVLHCPTLDAAHAAAEQLQVATSPIVSAAMLDGPHLYTLLHSLSVVA